MYKLFAYILLFTLTVAGSAWATEHTVVKGETLTEIAAKHSVTVEALRSANNLRDADQLKIGQVLQIPSAKAVQFIDYKVKKGDNLSDIARTYKASVDSIKSANGLTNANQIKVGQTLRIPTAGVPGLDAEEFINYRIKRGDNLFDIARQYGTTLQVLKAVNGISNANRISVGQTIKIPATGETNAPEAVTIVEYKIRKGDNLSEIAKHYGVSLKELANQNGITNANRIKVGQSIRIAVKSSVAPPPYSGRSYPELTASEKKALDKIKVKNRQWRHIVIHHTATREGTPKGLDRFHREERGMENGLAYHFVIGNGRGMKDGELFVGERWKRQIQGGHLSSYTLNQISIGICLVGDFSKTRPSQAQMDKLEAIVRYLMKDAGVPLDRVTTHTLIHPKHTICPGKYFPISTLKQNLAN